VNINKILDFKDVYKFYEKGGLKINVIEDLSFSLSPGTFTLINGPSGSGKTTIIYLAGLLKKPNKSEISISGIETTDLNEKERFKLIREQIGLIYQRSNLIPNLTALENVMLPMISSNKEKAHNLLEKVEIKEWNKLPNDLSFEDEQKVALARSLVNDPSLILADEPTAELDPESTENFMNLLNKMKNITILMTSDNKLLREYSDQTFELKDGNIQKYIN
jgi:putative ABC transport system ATP-binding protein